MAQLFVVNIFLIITDYDFLLTRPLAKSAVRKTEKLKSIPVKVSSILSSSPVLGRSVVVWVTGVTVVAEDAALAAVDAVLLAAVDVVLLAAVDLPVEAVLEAVLEAVEDDVEDAASAALPSIV